MKVKLILQCTYWTLMGVTAVIGIITECERMKAILKETKNNKKRENCIDVEEAY